ncbi:MAG: potassium-transporting ATPase subunit KdpC [Planctomycetes bacterium]|nr:potassium-transporting ATPase subunit KdpC [Planctomycetota bacterium]MBI3833129.1 potassium-transporting ATPase subunit KdpC [Planctomycetota bacterium]
MLKQLRISIVMFLTLTVLMGIAYPLVITGIAQVVFPSAANGSLIVRDGKTSGSELIGQLFDDPRYFWGRPSATTPYPYNAASSTGSNLAVSNPAQIDAVAQRVKKLHEADSTNTAPVPIDLVTASGSGLDPHISVAAAKYQVPRVAKLRNMTVESVSKLVDDATEKRQLGILGEPRVNVLLLNLSLEEVAQVKR